MITLYNTLTRQKETFKPIEPGKVKMYVCGPTVYNYIHIGNARPAINYDVVRRYFEYKGYEVNYVSNFTDVDDKLIKRAQELGETVPEIADRYIKAFHEDTGALNVKPATCNPRVMEHMDDIIQFIQNLIDEGYAYESGGDVYFRTRKFDGYGKLSHQSIDDLKIGARIEQGEQKEEALDFTLWKKAKPGEISWESPFGTGRPGWHIECSVMAYEKLGATIDIHAGGSDLQFPHHENEIAQSEAHNHAPFANYWMHNGFINIDNEKMSKSLGNFILVHDIIKEVDPDVLRFFMISVHYRSPINYNIERVEAARSGLERIRNSYQALIEREAVATDLVDDTNYLEQIEQVLEQFEKVMDDDFNTANAITAWYDLVKLTNKYMLEDNTSTQVIQRFKEVFQIFSEVLGIPLTSQKDEQLLDEEIEKLIEERNEARKAKDFARADGIRDQLKAQNIILEDTPQGVRFKRG
ncbi:cysteinyl-tRNA synthetase [Staphylococcus schleiferi]|uniref:cysteine--tRNA ligase n=1 Tax=Staphylococcus coagulans TaxID=74706 RepID=UPI00067A3676|nr:cysteine--tRNA ligase [Staphylococcus coagulans]AKS70042.1 cysteinyl-tRNA synthetase [Staphylococcus schleiferi]AKS72161.1 cysteinyl-tRNA synthetase [Staphylococcus schleiferi]AKS74448.1 cysteinyl-tRNA synthetase [Staphylococcus schleiferi]MBA8764155.1 cysteine--tRNA ligase [Staphylococcus coagulans]MBT2809731.1 cysteine--tRNA ligase [Staphylococcus coagulans]